MKLYTLSVDFMPSLIARASWKAFHLNDLFFTMSCHGNVDCVVFVGFVTGACEIV